MSSTNSAAPKVNPENSAKPKHFFYDDMMATAVTAGLQETIHEMCRLPCDFESSFIAQRWIPVGQASGIVELISEAQRGLLQIHFSDVATLTIMAKLLGRTPTKVNDEALDCVAALTGIVYGRMKALLNPRGYRFPMARANMSYTEKLSHLEGEHRHLVIPFRVASSKCFLQIVAYA